ncbi:zinc-ribbon domain-containing protein [Butyrivibrio sp. MB2005]|uniref:zinc-ribbon domain-containing protein n=1 Tax=Butyrivibrio sp. MB2005 TaxID=1280678 RepID=UPI00040CE4E7|nr:zinc-ribbon domain-containing protein [Butyrivibrio sp. MB2005]
MYCRKCGKQIPDDSSFCTNCGAKVVDGNTNASSMQNYNAVDINTNNIGNHYGSAPSPNTNYENSYSSHHDIIHPDRKMPFIIAGVAISAFILLVIMLVLIFTFRSNMRESHEVQLAEETYGKSPNKADNSTASKDTPEVKEEEVVEDVPQAEEEESNTAEESSTLTEESSDSAEEKSNISYSSISELPNDLPYAFRYSDGTNWQTSIHIKANGHFKGISIKTSTDTAADYPNGTKYVSSFTGQFTEFMQGDNDEYLLKLSKLEFSSTPEEWIEDGVRYIKDNPKGIELDRVYTLYSPSIKVSDTDEPFQNLWNNMITKIYDNYSDRGDTLEDYVLFYNDTSDTCDCFCGFNDEKDDYIYPDVYEKVLTDEDVASISEVNKGTITGRSVYQMIINEIYAKHKYRFGKEDVLSYFLNRFWYWEYFDEGDMIDDMASIEGLLSQTEKDNVKILKGAMNGVNAADALANNYAESTGEQDKAETNETVAPEEQSATNNDMVKVGDTFTIGGVKMSITGAELEYWTYNPTYDGQVYGHGMKYISVSFTVENIGTSSMYISPYSFNCYADDSYCDVASFHSGQCGEISPGRKTSFDAYWKVPDTAGTIELEYKYNYKTIVKIKIQ